MRIGELENAVGKELVGRRTVMADELSRLGARLAEPAHGATAPAVSGIDTVAISAEARAAQFAKPPSLPLGPFPSPAEVVSVLKQIAAGPAAELRPAIERLSDLVHRLANALPGSAGGPPRGAGNSAAGELVTALLRLHPAAGAPLGGRELERLTALVRELLATAEAARPGVAPGMVPSTAFERATALILVAAGRAAVQGQALGAAPAPGAEGFPAALLGVFGQAATHPVARKYRKPRRRPDHEDPAEDDVPAEDYPAPGSRRQ